MTPEEIKAEIARLEAENQQLLAGATPSEAPPQNSDSGFMAGVSRGTGYADGGSMGVLDKVGQGFVNVASGIKQMAGSALESATNPEVVSRGIPGFGLDLMQKAGGAIYHDTIDPSMKQTAANIADRTGEFVSSGIPVVGKPLYQAIRDTVMGDLQPADYYGEIVGQGLVNAPAELATVAAPAAAGMVKGAGQALRDVTVGVPEATRMAAMAERKAGAATVLGAGSGSTKVIREASLLDRARRTSGAFAENNPTRGIDLTASGPEQMAQLKNNITGIENSAVKTRNSIVKKASEVEAMRLQHSASNNVPFQAGLKLSDIPLVKETPKGPFTLEHIARKAGGEEGVAEATAFMQKEFGVGPSDILDMNGQSIGTTPSVTKSAQDLVYLRDKIDSQLTALGQYDDAWWISQGKDPSIATSYGAALEFYRGQIDKAAKGYMEGLVGPEQALQYQKAGEAYSSMKSYSPLVQRFENGTEEALATGSARNQQPGTGMLTQDPPTFIGKVANQVFPNRRKSMVEMGPLGHQRETNMIRQLQQVIEFQNNPALRPLPRGWAQIKTSAENLAKFSQLAMGMGLIDASMDLSKIPDKMAEQIGAQVAQMAPAAFEQNPDGLSSEFNGKIHNPQEEDMLKAQAAEKSTVERAQAMIGLNQHKYTPSGPTATPVKQQAPITFDSLSSLMPEEFERESDIMTASPDQDSVINSLKKATARHSQDWH